MHMQNKIHEIRYFFFPLGYAWDELVCTKCRLTRSTSVYSCFERQHLKGGLRACCQRGGEDMIIVNMGIKAQTSERCGGRGFHTLTICQALPLKYTDPLKLSEFSIL